MQENSRKYTKNVEKCRKEENKSGSEGNRWNKPEGGSALICFFLIKNAKR